MYLLGYDIVLCLIGSIKFSITEKSISPFFDSIYGYFNSLNKKEKKLVIIIYLNLWDLIDIKKYLRRLVSIIRNKLTKY